MPASGDAASTRPNRDGQRAALCRQVDRHGSGLPERGWSGIEIGIDGAGRVQHRYRTGQRRRHGTGTFVASAAATSTAAPVGSSTDWRLANRLPSGTGVSRNRQRQRLQGTASQLRAGHSLDDDRVRIEIDKCKPISPTLTPLPGNCRRQGHGRFETRASSSARSSGMAGSNTSTRFSPAKSSYSRTISSLRRAEVRQ